MADFPYQVQGKVNDFIRLWIEYGYKRVGNVLRKIVPVEQIEREFREKLRPIIAKNLAVTTDYRTYVGGLIGTYSGLREIALREGRIADARRFERWVAVVTDGRRMLVDIETELERLRRSEEPFKDIAEHLKRVKREEIRSVERFRDVVERVMGREPPLYTNTLLHLTTLRRQIPRTTRAVDTLTEEYNELIKTAKDEIPIIELNFEPYLSGVYLGEEEISVVADKKVIVGALAPIEIRGEAEEEKFWDRIVSRMIRELDGEDGMLFKNFIYGRPKRPEERKIEYTRDVGGAYNLPVLISKGDIRAITGKDKSVDLMDWLGERRVTRDLAEAFRKTITGRGWTWTLDPDRGRVEWDYNFPKTGEELKEEGEKVR